MKELFSVLCRHNKRANTQHVKLVFLITPPTTHTHTPHPTRFLTHEHTHPHTEQVCPMTSFPVARALCSYRVSEGGSSEQPVAPWLLVHEPVVNDKHRNNRVRVWGRCAFVCACSECTHSWRSTQPPNPPHSSTSSCTQAMEMLKHTHHNNLRKFPLNLQP